MGTRPDRERRTVDRMIRIYCQGNHRTRRDLCTECSALRDYADKKLWKCPFQDAKPTCARCKVHCYRPEMRERIREVMRYAGPRMFTRHPGLALCHFLDRFRNIPD